MSFEGTLLTWLPAVFVLMNRRAAISAFVETLGEEAEDLGFALAQQSEQLRPGSGGAAQVSGERRGPVDECGGARAFGSLDGEPRLVRGDPGIGVREEHRELDAAGGRLQRHLELGERVDRGFEALTGAGVPGSGGRPANGEVRDGELASLPGGARDSGEALGGLRRGRGVAPATCTSTRRASSGAASSPSPTWFSRRCRARPRRWSAAQEVEACRRAQGVGAVLVPGEQALGILDPALEHPELGELRGRDERTARGTRCPRARGALPDAPALGLLELAVRGCRRLGAAGAADRQGSARPEALDEGDHDLVPPHEPAGVSPASSAARVTQTARRRRRPRRRPRRRSRPPSPRRDALGRVHVAAVDEREPEQRERARLEVGPASLRPSASARFGVLERVRRVAGGGARG